MIWAQTLEISKTLVPDRMLAPKGNSIYILAVTLLNYQVPEWKPVQRQRMTMLPTNRNAYLESEAFHISSIERKIPMEPTKLCRNF